MTARAGGHRRGRAVRQRHQSGEVEQNDQGGHDDDAAADAQQPTQEAADKANAQAQRGEEKLAQFK